MASFPKLLRHFISRNAVARYRFGNLSMSRRVVSPSTWLMCPPSLTWLTTSSKEVNLNALNLNLEDKTTEVVGSTQGWLVLFNQHNVDMFLTTNSNPRELDRRLWLRYKGHYLYLPRLPSDHDLRTGKLSGFLRFGLPSVMKVFTMILSTRAETKLSSVSPISAIQTWDLGNPGSPKRIMKVPIHGGFRKDYPPKPLKWYCGERNYLVVTDGGKILVVWRHILTSGDDGLRRNPHKTVRFDVYKFDRKANRVKYMEGSLDGLTLFVGLNHSKALDD